MRKKVTIIALICLSAFAIWNVLHQHQGWEVKIGYSKTSELSDTEDQDDESSEIYDAFGNRLD